MDELNLKRLKWLANAGLGDVPPESLRLKTLNGWAQPIAEATTAALDEITEHEQLFDLRYKADQRAIERWRAEDPEKRALRLPDHTDLCVWLMDKFEDIDRDGDIITIHGVKYHVEMFRFMSKPTSPGYGLRIIKAEDGVITIQQFGCDQWQPIETAPIQPWDKVASYYRFRCLLRGRNPGSGPWVSSGYGHYVKPNGGGSKRRSEQPANLLRWKNDLGNCEPTHWMPLPSGEIEGA